MNQRLLFTTRNHQKWREFHDNNPAVFRLFRKFAEQALARGVKVGARLIGERIRGEVSSVHPMQDRKPN